MDMKGTLHAYSPGRATLLAARPRPTRAAQPGSDAYGSPPFRLRSRSGQFLDQDLDPHTRQDAYVLLDGRLGISNLEETLSLSFAVRNITNADVFEFVTDSTFFPGGYMAFQEFQRNVSAEVRYRF